jgi:tellurite methyltransferase
MATRSESYETPDWDKRYREGFYGGKLEPHELLVRHQGLIRPGGLVVDIAMGTGRDILFLAEKGSADGRGLDLTIVRGDANYLPFKTGIADGVIVFYFLVREMIPDLVAMLKPGGTLIYETYLVRQNTIDQPKNPAFLLDDGELRSRLGSLEVCFYEEGVFDLDGKQRAIARFVGRKS